MTLPAGPELDIAVIRACGIHIYESKDAAWRLGKEMDRCFYVGAFGVRCVQAGCSERPCDWSPSTSIADAFQALASMRDWRLNALRQLTTGTWVAFLASSSDYDYDAEGEGSTPAEAISRAIAATKEAT
jgi:hypothetical protein